MPVFFTALREHWGTANSELCDSSTFTIDDLAHTSSDKLADIAQSTWKKFLAAAFPPGAECEEDGYGSAAYIKTCEESFSLCDVGKQKASDVDRIAEMLEGCDEEAVHAFKEAFDKSAGEIVIADVGDEELASGCVIAAKRDGFVFGWVSLQD